MKKYVPQIVIVLLILILVTTCVILYGTPSYSDFSIHMSGVKITADGRIFDEGEIIIKGVSQRYNDTTTKILKPSELNIVGLEFSTSSDNEFVIQSDPLLDYCLISGFVYDPSVSGTNTLSVYLSLEEDCCVIKLGGRYQEFYFVGSLQEHPDYTAILDEYLEWIE